MLLFAISCTWLHYAYPKNSVSKTKTTHTYNFLVVSTSSSYLPGTNCVVSNIERLDVVSYTDRLAPFRVRFIFRQPPLPYVSNIFSMPFSTSVWIAMSVCAMISTLTVYIATKCEFRGSKVRKTFEDYIRHLVILFFDIIGHFKGPTQLDGIGDAMLLTFSAIGQQGCDMEPKRLSGMCLNTTRLLLMYLLRNYEVF